MTLRIKIVVSAIFAACIACLWSVHGQVGAHWGRFCVYLALILLSSGMKVALPRSEGTMAVNFPFIFLGILQLSPLQAAVLAASSAVAQGRIRVVQRFTLVQTLFNVANVVTATVLAWYAYAAAAPVLHGHIAPALALAAIVYYFANTIPVALVIALTSGAAPFSSWRQNFAWYLPFYLVGALLTAAANFVEVHFGWMTAVLLIPVLYIVYRAWCDQMAINRVRELHVKEMEALQLRTIEGLAMAIEAKDHDTHRHLMRVRVYVSEIGKLMRLDEPVMKALLIAAFLHDIGKLAIPEHILNKPGKLTPEEFEKVKVHPIVGADILDRVQFPYPVVPIVRAHHEAWDGTGYPDRLKGEQIPVGARILTVVDCFDALASERPYRRALPLDEAMTMVKDRSGTQFDPSVVELLEQNYERLEILAHERIDDLQPLHKDLPVDRKAVPGAGFETISAGHVAAKVDTPSLKSPVESLELIVAASQEAKSVAELCQMLGSSLSALETCAMTSSRLQRMIPFDCFCVHKISGDSVVPHYIDGPWSRAFSPQPIPLGDGVSGWVAQNGRTIVNGNPTVEPNYLQATGLFNNSSSALCIPLHGANGSIFGVVTLYSRLQTAFSQDHLRILQAVQGRFSLAIENALLFGNAETDAKIDHLTGLWNLRHFSERVDAAIQGARGQDETFAVVFCDLNSFKGVNDRYGHMTGNALLRSIADEFRACCRPLDTITRMGGDEFAFLFPSMDFSGAVSKLDALRDGVQRACIGLGIESPISGSMGLAFYPADGETTEALLGIADRSMYVQKRKFYDTEHGKKAQRNLDSIPAV